LDPKEIEAILQAAFPGAQIRLSDMTGGGDHWQLEIKAKEFSGASLVEQHKMIYSALGDLMKEKIHALAINSSPLEA
jgi:stress-induced morphogen